ncbi:hypothetical protein KKA00_03590 [bacterium]|nr:hypothetical protein [bacterium]MBU1651276.1 hypothetical protein [bacterium]MBU1881195.1 hypothetical protein [bacterium]
MESLGSKPVILIIESDQRLCEALKAELEGEAIPVCFSSVSEVKQSLKQGKLSPEFNAAIVQMIDNTKDELSNLTEIFAEIDDIPVFLTLSYDGNFQLEQSYIRSWTDHIYFRPFEVDKLIGALRAEISKQ